MKLNRTLVLCLAIVLSAAMALGSTLAYLQDSDSDVNVMTLGNVDIEQIEQKRDGNDLVDFTNDQWLYPGVYDIGAENDAEPQKVDGYYNADVKNAIDKIISVKNTGKSDAYVRTWIAFEQGTLTSTEFDALLYHNINEDNWTWGEYTYNVKIGDSTYAVVSAIYNGTLAANASTPASLRQVLMSKTAGNDEVKAIDGNGDGLYNILAYSQAVQTAGFADANTALEEAFGNEHPWTGEDVPSEIPEHYTGEQNPLSFKGAKTVELNNVTINATEGHALTIESGHVNLVITGDTSLIGGTNGSGIYVKDGATVTISGSGSLTAVGNNRTNSDALNGHGIGGEGTIIIDGLNNLTAEGWGKHAFGIGGASDSITIKNTNITYVKGGYVQKDFVSDTSYGTSEPEGGAAIGSSTTGAVITLNNVTIEKAEGGSKAAGIGAKFWTGVTINITDSTIKNVQGGNASAGIGGSRVASNDPDQDVTINIHNSTINATGGQFGAGIGSGYNTHCEYLNNTMHTINITGTSDITAQGGKYAAGIGTGYHVAALDGMIESDVTVNATAGASRDTYTIAQNVGFGVVDHNREAKDNNCSINYKGEEISIPAVQ